MVAVSAARVMSQSSANSVWAMLGPLIAAMVGMSMQPADLAERYLCLLLEGLEVHPAR
jgi:hypothetical protein